MALSAAITVIVASGLGLPVSSTHIAIGSIFGVGLFREFHANWLKEALERRVEARRIAAGELTRKQRKKAKKARRKKTSATQTIDPDRCCMGDYRAVGGAVVGDDLCCPR